ncbi:hydrogenase maturation protease [Clostridium thermarum]|uniref:hydrogenase maturation protease n=1 Tax=Clostridium thermarum TaxID=1716543 RepID=UPI0011229975|nr:hydrogenase maturation protease [Clostridium thermarum]
MPIKVIAIGNRLLGDDGVAIHIAEKLSKKLQNKGVEVIIGETDFQYCLSKIEEEDFIIILDATWYDTVPGTVTTNELRDVYKLSSNQSLFSQHGYSLIRGLETYYKSLSGIIIGIEGRKFDFDLYLSSEIEESFEDICKKVDEIIWNLCISNFGV